LECTGCTEKKEFVKMVVDHRFDPPLKGAAEAEARAPDDELLAKMTNEFGHDFSEEPDPEKRRLLTKLSKKGMHVSRGKALSMKALQDLEKMIDGVDGADSPPS